MRSLSLVMSECSLSGRGQGHVSNFYIVDLENFATASRRYTGDIHNLSVVGLFVSYRTMKATRSRHGWVHMFITHRPTVTLQLRNFDLFRTCRTSIFCTVVRGNWQDFNWHDASRGPSAIAELLIDKRFLTVTFLRVISNSHRTPRRDATRRFYLGYYFPGVSLSRVLCRL